MGKQQAVSKTHTWNSIPCATKNNTALSAFAQQLKCRKNHHKFLDKYSDKQWMWFLNFKFIWEYDITHVL